MDYPKVDRPTEPGHYWYRATPSMGWIMIEVFFRFDELWTAPPIPMNPRAMTDVSEGGAWRGPIPEPTP